MKVEVEVPENFLGDVMGDLNSRRGQIEGWVLSQSDCQSPLAEMFGYATDIPPRLRPGYLHNGFSTYDEVPRNVAEAITKSKGKLN